MKGWIIISLLLGSIAYGQEPVVVLDAFIGNDWDGSVIEDAYVQIQKGERVIIHKSVDEAGRVRDIRLPMNEFYIIRYGAPGYVTKTATLNTSYPAIEDLPDKTPFPVSVSLFKQCSEQDFGFLVDSSMIDFKLDEHGSPTWDQEKTKAMLKRIYNEKYSFLEDADEALYRENMKKADAAMEQDSLENAMKFYREIAALDPCGEVRFKIKKCQEKYAMRESLRAYEIYITSADSAFSVGNFELARNLYRDAGRFQPEEMYPNERLDAIRGMIGMDQIDSVYQDFIEKGDMSFSKEEFTDAKLHYLKARDLKPYEKYVNIQIELIHLKMQALAEVELEAQYQKVIETADKYYNDGNLERASALYKRALDLKPADPYPFERLKDIDVQLEKKE